MTQRLFEGNYLDVAISLNSLASLYQAQGRLSDAEPLFIQALEMRQQLFEGDHPDVATSLNNLAYLYQAQGRLSDAEPLYGQALEMFERTLGTNHPNTQVVRGNLEMTRQQIQTNIRSLSKTKPPTRAITRRFQLVQMLRRMKGSIRRFLRSLLRRLVLI
jgi:tetratricopeptide (TPR) repeat protein